MRVPGCHGRRRPRDPVSELVVLLAFKRQSRIQTLNSAALGLILRSSQGRGQGACEPGRGRGF